MNAVETNILIYVHDPRDANKQAVASDLVEQMDDGLLLRQVVCEFLAASRKLAKLGYNFDQALADVRILMTGWSTALPSWRVLDRAMHLLARYGLSYWDSMLAAACLEAGAEMLYSEDFGDLTEIDGLKLVNPFLPVK
ncbi:MAG TPA: PIN domain-containing protein [Lacipirellulaceae bacterium]|nr:PIN domain-containing protein [Lacipirellulaceae bacterium]